MITLSLDTRSENLTWIDLNVPILAPSSCLQFWEGAGDLSVYERWMSGLSGDYFEFLDLLGEKVIHFGDINASYTVTWAKFNTDSVRFLAVLKWLAAPTNYLLPSNSLISEDLFRHPLADGEVAISQDRYLVCDATVPGRETLADAKGSSFRLESGVYRVRYLEFNPSQDNPRILFGIYTMAPTK